MAAIEMAAPMEIFLLIRLHPFAAAVPTDGFLSA
jgi:hypothetical protein